MTSPSLVALRKVNSIQTLNSPNGSTERETLELQEDDKDVFSESNNKLANFFQDVSSPDCIQLLDRKENEQSATKATDSATAPTQPDNNINYPNFRMIVITPNKDPIIIKDDADLNETVEEYISEEALDRWSCNEDDNCSDTRLPSKGRRTSDYFSLPSCNTSRVSDCNTSPSSSVTSNQSWHSPKLRTKALSPNISIIFSEDDNPSVNYLDIPGDGIVNGDTATTPLGSCLRAGNRSSTGVHVQFESPRSSIDLPSTDLTSSHVKQDSLLGVCTNESTNDTVSRFFERFLPDGQSNDGNNSFKKRRPRHISSSSTASIGSISSSSSEEETEATEFERTAPDGGWGWVIVAAAFLVHCMADGVSMSFGILFVEFLDYFNEGKSLTSWIGSLFMSIPLLSGPLASLLTDRYGCKAVIICGGMIASFGFFLSAFADSILMLLLTIGVITGLGLSVCYVAAIVSVAFYFEKKRSLATGMAVAGSGIGTFAFAPLINYLVENFGWRGSMIILSGIFLNMVVCGSLQRNLEWKKRLQAANSRGRESPSHSSESVFARGTSVNTTLPSLEELRRIVQSGEVVASLSPEDTSVVTRRATSVILLPTFIRHSQQLPPDIMTCLNSKANAYEVVSEMYPHLLTRSLSELNQESHANKLHQERRGLKECHTELNVREETNKAAQHLQMHKMHKTNAEKHHEIKQIHHPLDHHENETHSQENTNGINLYLCSGPRHSFVKPMLSGCMGSDSQPIAPLRNMRVNKQSMTYRGAMLNIHRYRLRASSCPDIYRNSITTIAKQDDTLWPYLDDVRITITSCMDYLFYLDACYVIFAISNFTLYTFYDTVYMYLSDHAQEIGISADDSAQLISIIGILNTIGMVMMGYMGDQPWSSPVLIYNISMVCCGISIISMPFFTNYWLLACAAAVFGLFISANYALASVILVDLVSLEAFSKAYGVLLMIQGIGNLIGPPLVGYIADTTGSYKVPFVVSGTAVMCCGFLLNLIPLIRSRQKKQMETEKLECSSGRLSDIPEEVTV